MSAAVERITAECGSRFVGCSDPQHYRAFRRALTHRVAKIVGEIEHVVGTRRGAVGIGKVAG